MGLYTDLACEARELNPNIEGVSEEKEDYCDQREPRVRVVLRNRNGVAILTERRSSDAAREAYAPHRTWLSNY